MPSLGTLTVGIGVDIRAFNVQMNEADARIASSAQRSKVYQVQQEKYASEIASMERQRSEKLVKDYVVKEKRITEAHERSLKTVENARKTLEENEGVRAKSLAKILHTNESKSIKLMEEQKRRNNEIKEGVRERVKLQETELSLQNRINQAEAKQLALHIEKNDLDKSYRRARSDRTRNQWSEKSKGKQTEINDNAIEQVKDMVDLAENQSSQKLLNSRLVSARNYERANLNEILALEEHNKIIDKQFKNATNLLIRRRAELDEKIIGLNHKQAEALAKLTTGKGLDQQEIQRLTQRIKEMAGAIQISREQAAALDQVTAAYATRIRAIADNHMLKALTAGSTAMMGAGALGIAAVGAGVGLGSGFNADIMQIQHNTSLTKKEIDEANLSIRELGKSGADLKGLTEGFRLIENFGFGVKGSIDLLNPAMKATITYGGELNSTAELLAKTMTIFHIPASQATTTLNAMVVAAKHSSLELKDMVAVGGQIYNLGGNLGLTFAELNALLVTFTKHGLNASQAATQMKNDIQKIVAPTKDVQKKLAELSKQTGVDLIHDFSIAGLRAKGLLGVINDIRLVAKIKGVAETDLASKLFPNLRGTIGALIAVGNGYKGFTEELLSQADVIENRLNPLEEQFTETLGTTNQQVLALKNQFVLLTSDMEKAFAPTVTSALGAVTGLVSGFNALGDSEKNAIITTGLVVSGVSILAGAMLKGRAAIISMTEALAAYNVLNKTAFTMGGIAGKGLAGAVAVGASAFAIDRITEAYHTGLENEAKLKETLRSANVNQHQQAIQAVDDKQKLVASQVESGSQLVGLYQKYTELTKHTKLNKIQTKELQDTINKMSVIVPGVVGGYNSIGNAIGLNTKEVQKAIDKNKILIEQYAKLEVFKSKERIIAIDAEKERYYADQKKLAADKSNQIASVVYVTPSVGEISKPDPMGERIYQEKIRKEIKSINDAFKPLLDDQHKTAAKMRIWEAGKAEAIRKLKEITGQTKDAPAFFKNRNQSGLGGSHSGVIGEDKLAGLGATVKKVKKKADPDVKELERYFTDMRNQNSTLFDIINEAKELTEKEKAIFEFDDVRGKMYESYQRALVLGRKFGNEDDVKNSRTEYIRLSEIAENTKNQKKRMEEIGRYNNEVSEVQRSFTDNKDTILTKTTNAMGKLALQHKITNPFVLFANYVGTYLLAFKQERAKFEGTVKDALTIAEADDFQAKVAKLAKLWAKDTPDINQNEIKNKAVATVQANTFHDILSNYKLMAKELDQVISDTKSKESNTNLSETLKKMLGFNAEGLEGWQQDILDWYKGLAIERAKLADQAKIQNDLDERALTIKNKWEGFVERPLRRQSGENKSQYEYNQFLRDTFAQEISKGQKIDDLVKQHGISFKQYKDTVNQRDMIQEENNLQDEIEDTITRYTRQYQFLSANVKVSKQLWGSMTQDQQNAIAGNVQYIESLRTMHDMADGIKGVFNNMLTDLREHGFKNFFKDIIQGFEDMIWEMSARWVQAQFAQGIEGLLLKGLNLFGSGGGASSVTQPTNFSNGISSGFPNAGFLNIGSGLGVTRVYNMNMVVNAKDAESFKNSRTQVMGSLSSSMRVIGGGS